MGCNDGVVAAINKCGDLSDATAIMLTALLILSLLVRLFDWGVDARRGDMVPSLFPVDVFLLELTDTYDEIWASLTGSIFDG